jgi:hypothetical protein
VLIDQSRHCAAEDPQTSGAEPGAAKPASLHPPIDRPSADVQNSGYFIDTEQSLLL